MQVSEVWRCYESPDRAHYIRVKDAGRTHICGSKSLNVTVTIRRHQEESARGTQCRVGWFARGDYAVHAPILENGLTVQKYAGEGVQKLEIPDGII